MLYNIIMEFSTFGNKKRFSLDSKENGRADRNYKGQLEYERYMSYEFLTALNLSLCGFLHSNEKERKIYIP